MKRNHRFGFEQLESRAMLSRSGDFNGDGRDDLAIGVPGETVGAIANAGGVNIVYGSKKSLVVAGNQFWTLNSSGVNGVATAEDRFGSALVAGDFNNDGFSDLAIGIPFKTVNGQSQAGAVTVLFGSSSGLTGSNDQFWSQDSSGIGDSPEANDHFGAKLSTGDFNGDGRDDLVIGVPGEDAATLVDTGAVNVLYSSASGLSSANDQFWTQNGSGINDSAEAGDEFGSTLAAGDFNGDGRDDLAVGVTKENVGAVVDAGAVNVIFGSSSGLTGSGDQFWHQNVSGIVDDAEAQDLFGAALAAGDFNDDNRDDLAVGVPGESVIAVAGAGTVNIIYGSTDKLVVTGNVQVDVNWSGFSPQTDAAFGSSLEAGDFDGDGHDDLAIGTPLENITLGMSFSDAGAVYTLYGSAAGLSLTSQPGPQRWVNAILENDLRYGAALATGDYNGDGFVDLAVGIPGQLSGNVRVLQGFYVNGLFEIGTTQWNAFNLTSPGGSPLELGAALG